MFQNAITIGKIFGISIAIDASWLIIFLLITWNLAAGVLPALRPDWGGGFVWFMAVTASLLFFLSVLIHELAHSLVAKARGLPVKQIILFLFGGVSNIEEEPPSPGAEFWIAVVGPLASVGLGVLFWFLSGVPGMNGGRFLADPQGFLMNLSPPAIIFLWLSPINVLLGLFNLIPGFPLDGGRVLRSIFWAVTGNLTKATRWASWGGQAVALLFIVVGFSMVFGLPIPGLGRGLVSGIWLMFIGGFLFFAAGQSYRQLVILNSLRKVPVARIMRKDFPAVSGSQSVDSLVYDRFMGTDLRVLLVMDGDVLEGLVSVEDVRKVPREEWGSTPVSKIMTPKEKLPTISQYQDVASVLTKVMKKDINQVPVMENDKPMGVLDRRDIMFWLETHSE